MVVNRGLIVDCGLAAEYTVDNQATVHLANHRKKDKTITSALRHHQLTSDRLPVLGDDQVVENPK